MLLDYSMIFQELAPKELKQLGDVAEVELFVYVSTFSPRD